MGGLVSDIALLYAEGNRTMHHLHCALTLTLPRLAMRGHMDAHAVLYAAGQEAGQSARTPIRKCAAGKRTPITTGLQAVQACANC